MFQSLFNPDNPVLSTINKIVDLIALSVVWTICCIPIVTIGPACCGLYYSVAKCIRRERGTAIREFFRGFKDNFKQAFVINLVLIVFGVMMFLTDITTVINILNTRKIVADMAVVLFAVKAALLLCFASWVYPLMTRFSMKLFKLAETTLLLLVRYFIHTILMVAVMVIALLFGASEPLLLFFLPGLTTLILSFLLEPVYKKECDTSQIDPSGREDTWYLE